MAPGDGMSASSLRDLEDALLQENCGASRCPVQAQKLEAIGTLAGGIAHDFNNILTAIVGYSELALSRNPEDDLRDDIESILQASLRAAELVRHILTFSRVSDGEMEPVRLKSVVKEAVRLLRATIPSTIEIRTGFSSNSLVMADPVELHRVVVNLCTNAFLAMRETGGVLGIELSDLSDDEAFPADFLPEPGKAYVKVAIRDTGCGIPREIMGKLFEPFFTTRAKGEGTGMGLSVVHGIVTRYGGSISVDSEVGKGSAFTILLPVTEVAPERCQEPPAETRFRIGRILFVDDDPAIVKLARKSLLRLGHQVSAFHRSVDAVEAFGNDPDSFDVIITDLTMPTMTGEVLAQRVKALRPCTPVILCTGYGESVSGVAPGELRVDRIVMKPVLPSDLNRVIQNVLAD